MILTANENYIPYFITCEKELTRNFYKWFHRVPDAFKVLGCRGLWGCLKQWKGWLSGCCEATGNRWLPLEGACSQPACSRQQALKALFQCCAQSFQWRNPSFFYKVWCFLTMTSHLTSLDRYPHFCPLLYSTAKKNATGWCIGPESEKNIILTWLIFTLTATKSFFYSEGLCFPLEGPEATSTFCPGLSWTICTTTCQAG